MILIFHLCNHQLQYQTGEKILNMMMMISQMGSVSLELLIGGLKVYSSQPCMDL